MLVHDGQSTRMSIALIVSVALTAVVTLVLAAFAVFFYQNERDERWGQLHQALSLSAGQLSVAVALPTWNFDEKQILAIMRSGLINRDTYAIVVTPSSSSRQYILTRNGFGQIGSADQIGASADTLSERRAIKVGEQEIGHVTVYATPALLYGQLRQRMLAIIGVIVVLDVTLVLSLYLLLWLLMLKPLRAVGQYAASVKAGDTIAARPQRAWFFGELRSLNDSLRDMVALLDTRYQAMHRSEERLQMATSAAAIGIWDWNLVSNELVWDEQMYRQFQAEPIDGITPLAIWQRAMWPEDWARAEVALAGVVRGDCEFDHEFRITWPDGSVRFIKADAVTFRDDAGRPLRMVGTTHDITEHKDAEQELLRHRNHLEELVDQRTIALSVAVSGAEAANHAKSVFLANMSHELRTPLNSVIGFSRMMAGSTNMLPEEKRNLAIIHRSGNHLLTLINDILELSKIEAGRQSLQASSGALDELLHVVMDMVSMRAVQDGVSLHLDSAGMPAAALIDSTKLRQVLINLMSNAIKFAPHGQVTLKARGVDRGGRRFDLCFSVIDSGIGIALEDQERIFEPFIQAEGAGGAEGTGLGLTISREFVRLMGGQLTLASAPGQGATFSFTIPVHGAGQADGVPDGAPLLPAPAANGQRVLVVDDNADSCALLAGLLAPLGLTVDIARDGLSALSAVAQAVPALVFMDWRMPGMDGLETTRRLRESVVQPQPRIVMMTASAFGEARQAAVAAGANEFLRKPLQQDTLLGVLETQLNLRFGRSGAPAAPMALDASAVQRLGGSLCANLGDAVRDLNLGRVAAILDALPPEMADVVATVGQMLARYQYPQLCAMLDEGARLAAQANYHADSDQTASMAATAPTI